MPTDNGFFKRTAATLRRTAYINGCFLKATRRRFTYNTGRPIRREDLTSATPHKLPSKFLLRMRRQDCSPALAFLVQPQVLSAVWLAVSQTTTCATSNESHSNSNSRHFRRARTAAETSALNHSTIKHDSRTRNNSRSPTGDCCRRAGLHMRSANEEGHAMFSPCPRSSSLLAT